MRYFYYVHTGHRIGLDRFHRAVAIVNALQEKIDITLLCSDFRIASQAKEYGIKRAVGVDVVRNIPQIALHGDKIIFDSSEINAVLLDDMTQFFSTFIRVSDDPNDEKNASELLISPYLQGEGIATGTVIGEQYLTKKKKTIPIALFFGDDDYEKDLEKSQDIYSGLNIDLLMGFYHFLGYEKVLEKSFKNIYESEEYERVITESEILISASPAAVIQNLASGGKPIYIQRNDYPSDYIELFKSMNIPILIENKKDELIKTINETKQKKDYSLENMNQIIIKFIEKAFDLA